jgi:hypothetical protein
VVAPVDLLQPSLHHLEIVHAAWGGGAGVRVY